MPKDEFVGPLVHEGADDYLLPKNKWAWITIGDISLKVFHTGEQVRVAAYRLGHAAETSLMEWEYEHETIGEAE